jgi:hypothetical protein
MKCSTFLALKKVQQNCTEIPSHPSQWQSSRKQTATNAGEDAGKRKLDTLLVGMLNWCNHCRNQYGASSNN